MIIGLAIAAVSLGISGTVYAQVEHERSGGLGAAVTGTGSAVCKSGFDTNTGALTPPDDTTGDNAPAGSVQLTKTCTGFTTGLFTGEVTHIEHGWLHPHGRPGDLYRHWWAGNSLYRR